MVKLMEGDPEVSAEMEKALPPAAWNRIRAIFLQHEDALQAVVGGRYDWIEAAARSAVQRFRMGQLVLTDRIDHILTRPVFGIPILLAVFGAVFALTYTIGYPLQRGIEWLVGTAAGRLDPYMAALPLWLRGLVLDGIVGGVGSVLTLLPVLVIFFTVMAVLEDVGYLARAAFVLDRFMHIIGLHGKSAIPLCLGFGCNVSAVLGARIVESQKERLLTVFLSPFIPCTARLAVLTFVSAAMFPHDAALITWSLVTVNILVLGLVGTVAHRFFLKEEPLPFIMELPLYHKPDLRVIGLVVWTRTVEFVKRAGTVILGVALVVWLLSYLPTGQVEESILAHLGRLTEPIGQIIGLDWKMITALMTSIIAKENAVATLGILYGVGREGLVSVLPSMVAPASALSFLTVLMLFIPCAATAAAMRREMGSWKWFGSSLVLMLLLCVVGGYIAYRIGTA
ncbi:MAG: ferrous iron transporter B, partial [Syntrophales bacterium]|nr:ferrous iron transporter B [Syntrophales bacterium]